MRSNSTINQGRQFVSFANNVGGASAVTKLIKYSVLTVSTEVFFAPTNGNLQKQIAIIKDGTNNIVSGTLAKQIEIIKSITNNIFVGKTSSFNTVRADRTSIRADIITKLKVPIANTEIFYTPTSSNLEKRFETVKATTSNITVGKASSIAALKSVNNIIRTDTINRITVLNQFETEVFFTPTSSNLQKQIAIIRSIRNNIFVGKTSTVSSIKSSVFTLPINYNLQKQIEVIRATTSNVISGSLTKQIEVIRSDRASIRADIINKFSVPLVDTEVFYAPTSSNLQKQLEIVKATLSNIAVGKASTITSVNSRVFALSNVVAKTSSVSLVKSITNTIRADVITRERIPIANTEVFYTTNNYNLQKQIEVIKDLSVNIVSSSLTKQIEVIRADRASIRADIINKFRVPIANTSVFVLPSTFGKTLTITSINSRVFTLPISYNLQKQFENVKSITSNVITGTLTCLLYTSDAADE